MKLSFAIGAAAVIAAAASDGQAQGRFRGMDTNGDGVITRNEWRGNDRSFRNQDWNGDGVLSGDEVREGARRQNWNHDWNRDGRVDAEDRQIAERFRGYDVNNDGRVTMNEWSADDRLFARLDTNRDRMLTMEEYTAGAGFRLDAQGGPAYGFSSIDRNRDGWITRNEWNLGGNDFSRLDVNRDNRISRFEFENDTAAYQAKPYSAAQFSGFDLNRDGWISRGEWRMGGAEFNRFDTNNDNRISRFEYETVSRFSDPTVQHDRFALADSNGDGWLTRPEWRGTAPVFARLDTNRDGRLSRMEYDAEIGSTPPPQAGTERTAAWRMGYDRGIAEGMVAGRNDFNRRGTWDLEGQRELVNADSGYQSHMGSRSDYQSGYREGFRNAYRAGFLEARDNKK